METRTKEYVWAAKLSADNKVAKWSGREDGVLEQLVLKMAVLGPAAKEGERNIVEVTTFDSEQNKFKACICALGVGKSENQQLADLSLFPPVNFTLVSGSGPVHIVANHMLLDDDDLSDDEDMSDYEEEITDLRKKLNSKAKAAADGKGDGAKKSKKGAKEEDDDDMDDLDDDDFDDDEDDDELQGKDMIMMEADEDDEESDSSEKEEEAPSKKRKLTNGKAKHAAEQKLTSPDKTKQKQPAEQKTPKSQKDGAPKTPKSEKKTPSKPKFTSVEDVKAAIKKFPGGKPRKQDKFTNWLENQFKVSDDKWKTDLWVWHKKEIGL